MTPVVKVLAAVLVAQVASPVGPVVITADGSPSWTIVNGATVEAHPADAGQFDAPVTFTDPIYKSCLAASPLTEIQNPDGGTPWALLPPDRYARHACILASCEKDREVKQTADWATTSIVAAACFVVGGALAAGITVAAVKATEKK